LFCYETLWSSGSSRDMEGKSPEIATETSFGRIWNDQSEGRKWIRASDFGPPVNNFALPQHTNGLKYHIELNRACNLPTGPEVDILASFRGTQFLGQNFPTLKGRMDYVSLWFQSNCIIFLSFYVTMIKTHTRSFMWKGRFQSFIAGPREVVGRRGGCCRVQFFLHFWCQNLRVLAKTV
jgi:hypothetical protein